MKAMLSAFVVMGLISVGAYFGLNAAGFGFTSPGDRYFLFESHATDLMDGQQGNPHLNLFLYDTELSTTTLVSHADDFPLTGSNDDIVGSSDISPDGNTLYAGTDRGVGIRTEGTWTTLGEAELGNVDVRALAIG